MVNYINWRTPVVQRVLLAIWLMFVVLLSASLTARACDYWGDQQGVLEGPPDCLCAPECFMSGGAGWPGVCEFDFCRTEPCFHGYVTFCVNAQFCGDYPACWNRYCA
jgi:hypothetical protein